MHRLKEKSAIIHVYRDEENPSSCIDYISKQIGSSENENLAAYMTSKKSDDVESCNNRRNNYFYSIFDAQMEIEVILKNIKAVEATLRQLNTQLEIKTNEEESEKLKR